MTLIDSTLIAAPSTFFGREKRSFGVNTEHDGLGGGCSPPPALGNLLQRALLENWECIKGDRGPSELAHGMQLRLGLGAVGIGCMGLRHHHGGGGTTHWELTFQRGEEQ